jgi:hypothetical protein
MGFGADEREPDRVRAACAKRGRKSSSVLRDLLEREFPKGSLCQ